MTIDYKEGLVSIITPAYNAEKYIQETIESVLSQSYANWEMIIVDDKSTDKTVNIIEEFCDDRIKLVKLEKNGGTSNAWNNAFKYATGEYVAFLDSDDLWVSTKLEEQINFMKKNNYVFTFSSYDWIDKILKPLARL